MNTARPLGEYMSGGLAAVDPWTNTVAWRRPNRWWLSIGTGVLSTAGRLIFQGRPDGTLAPLDDVTGEELWSWQCGAGVNTNPINYEVDGEQHIAVVAGGGWEPVGPLTPYGDSLWAFKLGGSVGPAAAPPPPPNRNPVTAAPVHAVRRVSGLPSGPARRVARRQGARYQACHTCRNAYNFLCTHLLVH